MKEQELIYAEKSAKPSLLKILLWILVGDFVACILYGIAMGAGGSIDKQMENAPIFLAEIAVITAVLAILFYRLSGKRTTSISVYERTVVFSAPKVPMLDEAGADPVAQAVPEEPASEPEPVEAGEEIPVKRENPYLAKNRQKNRAQGETAPKKAESPDRLKISWNGEEDFAPERKIGKVTHDVPNSEVECPMEQIRSASRKGKSVVLIMENGDRYLFVRMSGAARLVKVIEDKVAAVVK